MTSLEIQRKTKENVFHVLSMLVIQFSQFRTHTFKFRNFLLLQLTSKSTKTIQGFSNTKN
ncbi:protein of unknown function [Streptococcus thermophilus]|nr:protein of unknown function [Streptococcus thermophilus]